MKNSDNEQNTSSRNSFKSISDSFFESPEAVFNELEGMVKFEKYDLLEQFIEESQSRDNAGLVDVAMEALTVSVGLDNKQAMKIAVGRLAIIDEISCSKLEDYAERAFAIMPEASVLIASKLKSYRKAVDLVKSIQLGTAMPGADAASANFSDKVNAVMKMSDEDGQDLSTRLRQLADIVDDNFSFQPALDPTSINTSIPKQDEVSRSSFINESDEVFESINGVYINLNRIINSQDYGALEGFIEEGQSRDGAGIVNIAREALKLSVGARDEHAVAIAVDQLSIIDDIARAGLEDLAADFSDAMPRASELIRAKVESYKTSVEFVKSVELSSEIPGANSRGFGDKVNAVMKMSDDDAQAFSAQLRELADMVDNKFSSTPLPSQFVSSENKASEEKLATNKSAVTAKKNDR